MSKEEIMNKVIDTVMQYKKVVLTIFMILFVFSCLTASKVKVNYNMMDYLPDESASTIALNIMEEEFGSSITNARVMLQDITIPEVLSYKEKLKQIEGILEVTFLDDTIDVSVPLEVISEDTLRQWYRNGNAILNLVVDEDMQNDVIPKIQEMIDGKGILDGSVASSYAAEQSTSIELTQIFAFVIPIILIILLLTTSSWFEPILFLITIGIAIVINMGTNIMFGELSFVTKAASSILQLAVSMDYSIFLLHRFSEYRNEGMNVEEAMKKAVVSSFTSILSSGLTTVVGFAALVLMNFKIGPDMGYVMTKAIICSLVCVLILLPILAVYSYKIIDKTHHKRMIPDMPKMSKFIIKIRKPACILFILLIIPCYLGSTHNDFRYGGSKVLSEETESVQNSKLVDQTFGKSNTIVIMVPKGDFSKERQLVDDLEQIEEVMSIQSYVTLIGESIPSEYVPSEQLKLMISEHYSRLVLNVNATEESKETFTLIDRLNETIDNYYEEYHLVGSSISAYDLKGVVTLDNARVNSVAIIAIAVILLFSFHSLSLPLILLLVIETSIWMNLTYSYFVTGELSYIAYLIISSIQLGATIDYAILFTDKYIDNRNHMTAHDASIQTVKETFVSILTSASIMMIAGFVLGIRSTNVVISELGFLIGRGALISTILVILVLPGLLIMLDRLIHQTTKKANFYQGGKTMKKGIGVFCIGLLLCSTMPVAALSKEENVYSTLSNGGQNLGTYVVNSYRLDTDGQICDYGDYREIRNLTNTNRIHSQGIKNCVEAQEGLFYYQGNLETAQLPWNFKLTYLFNGKEIDPNKLASQSGHIEIQLQITENQKATGSYFDHYLLQVTVPLSAKHTKNIQAEGGTIANVSGTKQITYNIFSGEEKNIKISFDATDFEMSAITFNGVPLKMDISIDQMDDVMNQITLLQDAVLKLKNGSSSLGSSLDSIQMGMQQLDNGVLKMKNGLDILYSKSSALIDSSSTLLSVMESLPQLLKQQMSQLTDDQSIDIGGMTAQDLLDSIEIQIKNDPSFVSSNPQLYALYQLYTQKMNTLKQIDFENSFNGLITSYQGFHQGLSEYVNAVNEISIGYASLYEGFQTLNTGIHSLKLGTSTLSNGLITLNSKTSSIDTEIETMISETLDSFRHQSYQPESFVSSENTEVSSVQFVIKTEGINKTIEQKEIKESKTKSSFFQKLKNLF